MVSKILIIFMPEITYHDLVLHGSIASRGCRSTGSGVLVRCGSEIVSHVGVQLCFSLLGWARVSWLALVTAATPSGTALSDVGVLLVRGGGFRLGLGLCLGLAVENVRRAFGRRGSGFAYLVRSAKDLA